MEKRERTMIDELVQVDEGLRDNEVTFIEDMSHRPDEYELSEKQLSWLEAIWDRVILKAFNR